MVYFLFFIFLLILTILEFYIKGDSFRRNLFFFSGLSLLIFCSFRFGVGYDYFSYWTIFDGVPSSFSAEESYDGLHGEPLFLGYFILMKYWGIDYAYANSLIIFITVLLSLNFIWRYSPYKVFSILILYTWYFVYIFSLLRQGLALGIFLGIAYPLFVKEKYFKYLIVVLGMSLFHNSAIICLFIPLIAKYFNKISKFYILLVVMCFFLALINNPLIKPISPLFGYPELNISYPALFNRVIAFLIILFICKPKEELFVNMKNIYFAGFLLYLFVAPSELISSRLASYMKVFDIILIPLGLQSLTKRSYPVFILLLSVYLGYMLMNIISAIADGYGLESGWNYPYITIFNQDDLNI